MSLLFMVVRYRRYVEGKFDFVFDWHCKKNERLAMTPFPEVARTRQPSRECVAVRRIDQDGCL